MTDRLSDHERMLTLAAGDMEDRMEAATHSVNGTAPAPSQDTTLTAIERGIVERLYTRQRDIEQATAAVQQEGQTVAVLIEQRLGLEPGAIGTTHGIQDGQVVALPQPDTGTADGGPQAESG